mmetsp:Transcript_34379/g.67190  ORF Transcript_34379/g.67190 Transcript_34379/m.67190 type:complete len:241 (-) Transcript_34379:159-881(-)
MLAGPVSCTHPAVSVEDAEKVPPSASCGPDFPCDAPVFHVVSPTLSERVSVGHCWLLVVCRHRPKRQRVLGHKPRNVAPHLHRGPKASEDSVHHDPLDPTGLVSARGAVVPHLRLGLLAVGASHCLEKGPEPFVLELGRGTALLSNLGPQHNFVKVQPLLLDKVADPCPEGTGALAQQHRGVILRGDALLGNLHDLVVEPSSRWLLWQARGADPRVGGVYGAAFHEADGRAEDRAVKVED